MLILLGWFNVHSVAIVSTEQFEQSKKELSLDTDYLNNYIVIDDSFNKLVDQKKIYL